MSFTLKIIINKIFKGAYPFKKYFNDIAVVFAGNAFAEMLLILIIPLLTRIYTPKDFGHFGFVTAFSSLLAQFSTLRYENAIIIAPNFEKSFQTAKFCQYLTIIIHLVFIIVTITFYIVTNLSPKNHTWADWIILIPIVSFSSTIFRIQSLLNNRVERFKVSSKIKALQSLSMVLLSIIFGMSGYVNDGLIWALILSYFGGAFLLRIKKNHYSTLKIKEFKKIAKRYNNFLYYSLMGGLINNVISQYPLMVFPFLFGNEVTGYITLAYRFVAAPVRFILSAISDVFFQYASKEMRDKSNCRHLFTVTSTVLLTLSLIIFGILYVLSDYIFEVFFEEKWRATGDYVKFLVPLFIISSVVSPLSSMIYVAEKQNWHLYWSSLSLFLMSISTLLSYRFFGNIKIAFLFFVVVSVIAYIMYFLMLCILTKRISKDPHVR